jgi:hypothetical protein
VGSFGCSGLACFDQRHGPKRISDPGGKHISSSAAVGTLDGKHFSSGAAVRALDGKHFSSSAAIGTLDGKHFSSSAAIGAVVVRGTNQQE